MCVCPHERCYSIVRIESFSPYNFMSQIFLSCPFYRWGNWNSESLKYLAPGSHRGEGTEPGMNPGCLPPRSANKNLVWGLCSSFPTGPLPRRALRLEFNACGCHLEIHFISEFVFLSETTWDSRAWLGARGALTHMWSHLLPVSSGQVLPSPLAPLHSKVSKAAYRESFHHPSHTETLLATWARLVTISFQDLCRTPKPPRAKAQVQWQSGSR